MQKYSCLKSAAILVAVFITGCSSVTLRDKGTAKINSEPGYDSSKPFFLWGLAGEHHINVQKICNGSEPKQIQSVMTFTDGFLYWLTFGIYAPRTVRVWCK